MRIREARKDTSKYEEKEVILILISVTFLLVERDEEKETKVFSFFRVKVRSIKRTSIPFSIAERKKERKKEERAIEFGERRWIWNQLEI